LRGNRDHRAVIGFTDKLRHLRRGQVFRQRFDARVVCQGRVVTRILAYGLCSRSPAPAHLCWHQPGFQRVVTVDHRQVDIIQGARDLRRFNLQNLQVFRVLDNIFRRRQRGRVGE
jgi:hypothetical protein